MGMCHSQAVCSAGLAPQVRHFSISVASTETAVWQKALSSGQEQVFKSMSCCLPSCVTLGKFHDFSGLQFLRL